MAFMKILLIFLPLLHIGICKPFDEDADDSGAWDWLGPDYGSENGNNNNDNDINNIWGEDTWSPGVSTNGPEDYSDNNNWWSNIFSSDWWTSDGNTDWFSGNSDDDWSNGNQQNGNSNSSNNDWWSSSNSDWWHIPNNFTQWNNSGDSWWSNISTIENGNDTISWSVNILGLWPEDINGTTVNQTNANPAGNYINITSPATPWTLANATSTPSSVGSNTTASAGSSNMTLIDKSLAMSRTTTAPGTNTTTPSIATFTTGSNATNVSTTTVASSSTVSNATTTVSGTSSTTAKATAGK
ncbi:bifunctional endo-1,4-beta-xylanase XylA-like [Macrobrachium nipponense]|uniref:bifunctional endo-1,4-beta-xylanase XylA-like n=1 Tax=Macrobrachium nipponense TaxID=159736 RepID=UPI0030C7C7E7